MFRRIISAIKRFFWQKPKPAPSPPPTASLQTARMTYLSPFTNKQVSLRRSQMSDEDWDKACRMVAGLDTAVWMSHE